MKKIIAIKENLEHISNTLFFLNQKLLEVQKQVEEALAEEEAPKEEPSPLAPETSVHVENSSITAKFTEEQLHFLYEEEAERYFNGL
jgi:hypothetical protein